MLASWGFIMKNKGWERAMLTLSLHKFIGTNLPKDEMFTLLKNLNSNKIKIISFVKPGMVVFKKRNCSYVFVGKKFEKWLFKNFELKKRYKNELDSNQEKSKKIKS